jgi:SAM-dependent methyltransferase
MSNIKSVLEDSKYLEHTYSNEIAPPSVYPNLLSMWLLQNAYGKTGKIVDFGCGRGDYLHAFRGLGFEPAGLDISPSIENLSDYTVEKMNFEDDELPFPKESFDFAFSKSVIEHLRDPHYYLKGIRDSLKDGGKAVIMTPSWSHTYWGPFYIDHTHVSPYTLFSLKTALEIAGFKNVKVNYFYQLPFLWRFPWLKPLVKLFAKLPLPYSPYNEVPWATSNQLNKLIRFSKEAMLIAVVEK